MKTMTTAEEIGMEIGRAIAEGHRNMGERRRPWTGMGSMGSDRLLKAGIKPGSQDWLDANNAANRAYDRTMDF